MPARAIIRLSKGAVLRNVELPSGCRIVVDSTASGVTIDNVTSSGQNTDRPEVHFEEGCKNIKVDGKKVC